METEALAKQGDEMEKNLLLYQCFALLTKIEPDYFPDNPTQNIDDNNFFPSPDVINSYSTTTDDDIHRVVDLLAGSKLATVLTRILAENKELQQRCLEHNNVNKVKKVKQTLC